MTLTAAPEPTRRRPLPEPRGLTREQAAHYCGLSMTKFDQARAAGQLPQATLPAGRWDRKVIDRALDRLSGLDEVAPSPASASDAFAQWKSRRKSA